MRTVDIGEAKEDLVRLVREAVKNGPFIIARDGQPLVKVVPVTAARVTSESRTGFQAAEVSVPADFDRMGASEVEALFEAGR
ncbi:type II toxin-antitoxin system Phd/YefM family antitoxin [Candidatus Palauibacter sp.]|uniref:type II toxin-antitoxin system Phd/YefM family antitoxin n=1 Tax=Candidatus Palauibacter sp. TaxID=3101350 RepID=UPI003AF24F68